MCAEGDAAALQKWSNHQEAEHERYGRMRDRTIAFVGVIIGVLSLVAGVVVFSVSQNKIANLKSGLKDAKAQIESN